MDSRNTKESVWWIILTSKLFITITALAGLAGEFNTEQFFSAYARWPPGKPRILSSQFATWDSAHYLRLSYDGYQAGSLSCAFYPLWPGAIHLAAAPLGGRPLLAGMLLANALSIVGFWLFYRLVERHYTPAVARDSLILMLTFPGALFFSFPYTEALYLVLLMVLFWGLELKRWSWTAVAGFLLPLARPVGIFLIAPLAWYFFERTGWARIFLRTKGREGGAETSRDAGVSGAQPARLARLAIRKAGSVRFFLPLLLLLCPLLGYAAYFGVMYAWMGN